MTAPDVLNARSASSPRPIYIGFFYRPSRFGAFFVLKVLGVMSSFEIL